MNAVISAECAASFDELTRSNLDDKLTAQTKNDWPNQFRVSRFISAVDYINANRYRYILMQNINAVVNQFDAIICPTWSGNQNTITNLTGHPALCMPTGFDKDHLPTSITLVGKLYGEAALLEVAKLYQDATQWNKMHPDLFK
jgi:Asp-tRNA(Asn)/Glu-tRNA(Gln) amidotransferase A subunit family amidase